MAVGRCVGSVDARVAADDRVAALARGFHVPFELRVSVRATERSTVRSATARVACTPRCVRAVAVGAAASLRVTGAPASGVTRRSAFPCVRWATLRRPLSAPVDGGPTRRPPSVSPAVGAPTRRPLFVGTGATRRPSSRRSKSRPLSRRSSRGSKSRPLSRRSSRRSKSRGLFRPTSRRSQLFRRRSKLVLRCTTVCRRRLYTLIGRCTTVRLMTIVV